MRLVVIAALALAACEAAPYVPQPPYAYRGDRITALRFTSDMRSACGPGILACNRGTFVILPNPCGLREPFAELTCHELAHRNGWPAHHPKD